MSTRTIRCSMSPTPTMASSLSETCAAFTHACNAILEVAVRLNTCNNILLHHECYYDVRAKFTLSSNLTVRAIRRVSAMMTRFKKSGGGKPKIFKPTSIDYDARIFDYREMDEVASLTVMGGRIHVPLRLGSYQRDALKGKNPTSAVVVKKGREWRIHIVVEDTDNPPRDGPPMGVDLGIRNTAASSTGKLDSGVARQDFKKTRMRVRASLQSRGTAGSRRVLKRLSGYENRRIRHENHVISKALVAEAIRHNCGIIRMEQLKDIRKRTKIRNRHFNRMVSGWSFGQLQQFVEYKAKRAGLKVEYVNPAYTSQTCSVCGVPGMRSQDIFRCPTCGEFHADINAARNIARGGVAYNPTRMEKSRSA